ncbi:MAG: type 2 isopentenyl-diphosphate Delta-isomerase [Acholeplasmataceae bacterium]
MSNRKDDHIHSALDQHHPHNDFDHIRFVPEALCQLDCKDIDTSVAVFGHVFDYPVYINAMSGGSNLSKEVNDKLSKIAKSCNLPMATGSVSAAIKDPSWTESFSIVRDNHPEGFVFANVGLSQTKEGAQKAIDILNANALQIHLNAAQEITMPEGDREFSHWKQRLKDIMDYVSVPVMVKEVGFGMSKETIDELYELGVETVDVSGKGGTNFIQIENERRQNKLNHFDAHGFSTVESLLDAKLRRSKDAIVFASGGIRGAYDIVKALALGASMVGLSGYFLKLVQNHTLDEAISHTQTLLSDIKNIMAVLNAQTIEALRKKPLLLSRDLIHFMNQRKNSI